jgi:hypothetical protein
MSYDFINKELSKSTAEVFELPGNDVDNVVIDKNRKTSNQVSLSIMKYKK